MKRIVAVILAAVVTFSTVGECKGVMAAELATGGKATETTESTENTEVIETTESTGTVETEVTTETAETTEETGITEATEVTEVTEVTETTETAEVTETTEPTETTEETESAEVSSTIKGSVLNPVAIGFGTDVYGNKAATADNYYQFTTGATGAFYTVKFSNIDASNLGCYVYSDSNELNKIAAYGYCATKETGVMNLKKLEKNHTYYIRIFSNYSRVSGNFKLTVEKKDDVVGDTMTEATAVALQTEVNGTLDNQYDKDCYQFTTDGTDSFYTFSVSNLDAGSLGYTIYNDENELEKIASGSYCSAKETYTANLKKLEKNHTYYLKIDNNGNTEISYKFIVNKAVDDVKDTMAEATGIALNTTASGRIDNETDTDCFRFTTDGTDSFYSFILSNIDVSYVGYVIYSDENELNKIVYDNYIYAKRTYTENLEKLEKNHTYYIKIKHGSGIGNYKFTVRQSKDDVKDTAASAKTLNLNETKTYGLQNQKDVDYFKFKTTQYTNYTVDFANLTAEDVVYIKIYSGKDCLNNQLVLHKYCSKKNNLSTQDKALKLKTGKTYYVVISGSSEGKYKLGISATAPASAKVKAAAGKVTVSWKKVDKSTGYQIYRSTSRDGKYTKIKTIGKSTTLKYTDSKGLKKGKTYYYKIRAYKKSGKTTYYSAYSSVKSVKAK